MDIGNPLDSGPHPALSATRMPDFSTKTRRAPVVRARIRPSRKRFIGADLIRYLVGVTE
jgi:hypothetical protein